MEIVQEMGRSILIVEDLTSQELAYMRQMLTYNRIPGIIPCMKGLHDNKSVLKYDITNMKSIDRLYETGQLTYVQLRKLLRGINAVIIRGRSYLFNDMWYLMSPEFIYYNSEDDNFYLIYVPFEMDAGVQQGIYGKYYELADYFLDRINHKDENAVSVAYQFYRMSKEPLFSMDAFIPLIERENSNLHPELMQEVKAGDGNDSNQVFFDFDDVVDVENAYEEKRQVSYMLPVALLIAISVIAVAYWIMPEMKSMLQQVIIVEILLTIVLVILVARNIVLTAKKGNTEIVMPTEQVTVDEYWSGDNETQFFYEEKDDVNEETQFFDPVMEKKYKITWEENGKKRVREVERGNSIIGKKYDEVDLCISDPTISRKHARLTIDKKGLWIQDLGSKNGTYIDGNRILPGENVKIDESSEIRFGKVAISVV